MLTGETSELRFRELFREPVDRAPTRFVAGAGLAGLLLFGGGCDRSRSAVREAEGGGPVAPVVREVEIVVAAERAMERTVPAIGTLIAREEATLSVNVPGRLQHLAVDLGSPVRRGQLLAQVDPLDYELELQQAEALLAQARTRLGLPAEGAEDTLDLRETSTVRQARARLDEAQRSLDRLKQLAGQGILSQSDLEAGEAVYEVASSMYRSAVEEVNNRLALLAQRKVEVEIARKRLADTAIQAPFDGATMGRQASPGEYLAVGTPVVTVVAVDPLRLRLEISEREAPSVRVGQEVRVTVEGDPKIHTGTIARVSPAITAPTRVLIVEADVPNDGSLRPGSFARAEIVVRQRDTVVAVPRDAVLTFAGLEKVFTVRDGQAVERVVRTGRRRGDWIEVERGVEVGERVVLRPGNLQTGQAVRPVVRSDAVNPESS
jgi:RND family efflux transporter MFP subunit